MKLQGIKRSFILMKTRNVLILTTIFIVVFVSHLVLGMYVPRRSSRQQDDSSLDSSLDSGEEDDMDQTASSPHRNHGGENGNGGTDGYEENEPDGPYGETPREEEGQADLERFFDDHLGASERDGMDKENLPTNDAPIILAHPAYLQALKESAIVNAKGAKGSDLNDYQTAGSQVVESSSSLLQEPSNRNLVKGPVNNYLKDDLPDVETSYVRLPNKKLIITRKITTRDPLSRNVNNDNNNNNYVGSHDLSHIPLTAQNQAQLQNQADKISINRNFQESPDSLTGNDVEVTENDDYDRVYVTNKTNQPFRIEALGGYDPEEDFQNASKDIEEPTKFSTPSENAQAAKNSKQPPLVKDINFNDPETDTLFNDASETDEVTFNQEDPDNTELEEDLNKSKKDDKLTEPSNDSDVEVLPEDTKQQAKRNMDSDDAESNWVNDGVDDMEIPSQSDQDRVLEKAARLEELANKRRDQATDPNETNEANLGDSNSEEEESQRMPNADYLKGDLSSIDDDMEEK